MDHLRFALRALGGLLFQKGEYVEAEACFREALPLFVWAFGADSDDTFLTLNSLRATIRIQGKHDADLDRIAYAGTIQQVRSPTAG